MRIRRLKVRSTERGLLYRDRVPQEILDPGVHWRLDPRWALNMARLSIRDPWIRHEDLEFIVRQGLLPADQVTVVNVSDNQRAVVRVNGRFDDVVGPGVYALWTILHDVDVDVFDATEPLIEDHDILRLARQVNLDTWISFQTVPVGHRGILYVDGQLERIVGPGRYATWDYVRQVVWSVQDVRELRLDIVGQDIMTSDRVTLRLNGMATYQITDPEKAATRTEDFKQALYREVQLALRASVGARELDSLLASKSELATELLEQVQPKAAELGVLVSSIGIRDVILPGEMKTLLNQVTEARKAAEANLVTRREETAAMRSQANTAKLLENNPMLMRLRELEVLEKVAEKAQLTVMLGEGGLTDRVVKLL